MLTVAIPRLCGIYGLRLVNNEPFALIAPNLHVELFYREYYAHYRRVKYKRLDVMSNNYFIHLNEWGGLELAM